MSESPAVVVLGSAHMDLIASAARMPGRGESVAGGSFAMAPGGKAANQACQLARAGARPELLTRLGEDAFGAAIRAALAGCGVGISHIATDPSVPTGASTVLAAEGDYTSIIAPGAAGRLTVADVVANRDLIAAADALVLQLELAPDVSAAAAEIAAGAGRMVVLNASPAPPSWQGLPLALRKATTVLVVNRVEAGLLLGRAPADGDARSTLRALADLTGVSTIILTLGAMGSAALAMGDAVAQPAFAATVVDAVGAGDAFLGTVVVSLLRGGGLAEALSRGAAAGAITVGRPGGYASMPSTAEVDAFLTRRAE